MAKLWGGRFLENTDEFAEGFHSSISFDSRLVKEDIRGSIAHARMLGKQGIISLEDSNKIIEGLESILEDALEGKIEFSPHDEDIHMNVEKLLTERIGEAGKRLHTGRSRNDQVALDFKMYVKSKCIETECCLKTLIEALINISENNLNTIMPAYTHLQKAQPTTLGHYMMAYAEMFYRDITRFSNCYKRTDVMPLGSGALCGTTYNIDRYAVKDELGFNDITLNSIDGVSDRDFAIEFLSASSICMMHLSRFCEELILWSSNEFGFVTMDDKYSTGSSIMPQKKNPDMAELIRGKTGRVYGNLMTLLTVMKGIPLAYNKDMQEDKECLFDAADTVISCIKVFTKMISTVRFNKETMYEGAKKGFTNATDAADHLVKNGLAFRDAHAVIGSLVLYCEQNKLAISDLPLEKLKEFSPYFSEKVFDDISLESCVLKRNIPGAPSPVEVKKHIDIMKKRISEL